MIFIIKDLVEKAQELGFDFDEDDVIFDDSRAYSLYVYGSTINEPVYKFGAWRNYLGGGLRDSIQNSSMYVEDEKLKKLAMLFADALKQIEDLDDYEDFAEHL
jgi:hypothetical protein